MTALRRLGRYLLVEPLARGGMGEVWLARPEDVPGAPPLCVVKTLREGLVADGDARARFVDESRVALLLSHPCVCRTVDAGSVGDTLYIALEVVEGIDVRHLALRAAEAGHPIDEDLALWIVGCAADGLAFAHEARHPLTNTPLGIVHRDVSPQNLMCAVDGTVRVIDFGLALSSLKEAQTERDVVLGKLSYMPPEQATGRDLDVRCDVFALGVVLYELLTGERYWGALKHDQIWARAGAGRYTPPGLARLSGEIRAVVARAIAPAVSERTETAGELRDQIARLLGARGGAVAAAARLGALVKELALPELQRIEAARAGSDTLPPDLSSPVMSIALEEVRAIEAMLAREPPPPPTISMAAATQSELAVADTVRRSAAPVATPGTAVTTELPLLTLQVRAAPRRPPWPIFGALAVLVLIGGVVAAALAFAPRAPPTLAQHVPAPVAPAPSVHAPTVPAPIVPAPAAPVPVPPVEELAPSPAAGPKPPRLSVLLRRLEPCDHVCARTLRSTTRDVDRLTGADERDVRRLMQQCLAQCR